MISFVWKWCKMKALMFLKACVCYFLLNFWFQPNDSPWKNYEKCSLFHIKSSFRSWDFFFFQFLFYTIGNIWFISYFCCCCSVTTRKPLFILCSNIYPHQLRLFTNKNLHCHQKNNVSYCGQNSTTDYKGMQSQKFIV